MQIISDDMGHFQNQIIEEPDKWARNPSDQASKLFANKSETEHCSNMKSRYLVING